MQLTWYGTAALLFRQGENALAFDPFFGIPPESSRPDALPKGTPLGDFRSVRHIVVTHGHFDHIAQLPSLLRRCPAVVYATRTPCGTLLQKGVSVRRLHEFTAGERLTIAGTPFTLRTFPSRHCRFDTPLVLRTGLRMLTPPSLRHGVMLLRSNHAYPENRETVFYELCAGGCRVQVMGSMGLDPSTRYPTGADVLILPFQGRSDPLPLGEEIVRRLRPKAVLLDHYDDSFPPMTSPVDTLPFEALIQKKYRIPCRALRRGVTYHLEEIAHEQGNPTRQKASKT